MEIYKDIEKKKKVIAVIGLGYIGLPLALAFAKKFRVIGFDINEERIALMQKQIDPSKEMVRADFEKSDIYFTSKAANLSKAHFFIIGVPTDVDHHKVPNLLPLKKASESVGKALKKGDYVIFESTVYPGCTEEDCLPILEKTSGLTLGKDFKIGYSPERINPGDKTRPLQKILKVVSGSDKKALEEISKVYASIIDAGIYQAPTIKVAEAAKIIENTQRDLNISLMNELAIIFDKMDIDTHEVLKAAGTKWNFLKFHPGIVGGHCIGVDPYYLVYKAKKIGYDPQVILSGRRINDDMPMFIAKRLVQMLIQQGKSLQYSKVLVMGVTFKENVSDVRNSKVFELIKEINDYSVTVETMDPKVDAEKVSLEYGVEIQQYRTDDYDAVVIAVAHDEYKNLTIEHFKSITNEHSIIMDLKGIYKPMNSDGMVYWRL